jgi:hypothetical protein
MVGLKPQPLAQVRSADPAFEAFDDIIARGPRFPDFSKDGQARSRRKQQKKSVKL